MSGVERFKGIEAVGAITMKLLMAATLVVLGLSPTGLAQSEIRIVPFINRIDDGPAFFVECRNTSQVAVSSSSREWPLGAVRIDEVIVNEPEGVVGPGLTRTVEPGDLWRGIVAFRQSASSYFPAPKFGAMVRFPRLLKLTSGRHTIAVRCQGVWSNEIEFYWDDEPNRQSRP